MLYTPWVINYSSPMYIGTLGTIKNPSERKFLSQFSAQLNFKQQTDVHRMGAIKKKHITIIMGIPLWFSIPKQKGHTKKLNLVLHNSKVVQYPLVNYFLKVSIDGQIETQVVREILFNMSVREIHKNMVSPPYEWVLKEARDKHINIIISDSVLQNILTPQLKKIP